MTRTDGRTDGVASPQDQSENNEHKWNLTRLCRKDTVSEARFVAKTRRRLVVVSCGKHNMCSLHQSALHALSPVRWPWFGLREVALVERVESTIKPAGVFEVEASSSSLPTGRGCKSLVVKVAMPLQPLPILLNSTWGYKYRAPSIGITSPIPCADFA